MIHLENVLKTSLEDVLKMSWRRLEDIFARRLENVLKTPWRRMTKTNILVLIKTSWRRFEDVFWRRMCKVNIFVLIKTSWRRLLKTKTKDVFKTSSRRLHQDECLLGHLRVAASEANKQLDWNHTSAWVFSCKFAACFQNTFFYEHLWVTASRVIYKGRKRSKA